MTIRFAAKKDFEEILRIGEFSCFSWEYIEDIAKVFQTKNVSLYIEHDDEKYIIPLIKKIIFGFYPVAFSIPFGLYGGIMANGDMDAKTYAHLMKIVNNHLKMAIIFQNIFQENLLSQAGFSKIKKVFAQIVYTKDQDYEKYYQSDFEYKMRKNVKKAIQNDIRITAGNTLELISDYYKLYEISNIRWGKKRPRYGIDFFKGFSGKDYFQIRIAYYQGKPAAGLVMLKFNNYYFGWFGGINKELGNTRANDFLHADLIRESIEKNYAMINFGASSKLSGVQRFKESFGAKEKEYHTYFYGNPVSKAILLLIMKIFY